MYAFLDTESPIMKESSIKAAVWNKVSEEVFCNEYSEIE